MREVLLIRTALQFHDVLPPTRFNLLQFIAAEVQCLAPILSGKEYLTGDFSLRRVMLMYQPRVKFQLWTIESHIWIPVGFVVNELPLSRCVLKKPV